MELMLFIFGSQNLQKKYDYRNFNSTPIKILKITGSEDLKVFGLMLLEGTRKAHEVKTHENRIHGILENKNI